jgi:acetoin utilization deacetylase AcuC-like enzyme
MAPVAYLRSQASLLHDTGAHPERIARIPAIEAELAERGWAGLERMEAPAADEALLLTVHSPEHVAAIRSIVERGGGAIDMDTVTSPGSWEAALHSAGGAVRMADLLVGERSHAAAFCGLRPPGHHAEPDRAMGFCLFANVAIAARRAQQAHGVERVLVLDWDVHHGNGTNDIFHEDPSVLFVSIHQWPLYPGSGDAGDVGRGAGRGFTVNLPVPPGSGDETFVSHVEHLVAPLAREYDPGLILVSAGYDAHRDDPLADCEVTEAGYAAMAASVRRAADALGVPVGAVLEGGYELSALARSVAATLEVLAADAAPPESEVPLHPLTAEALERASEYWPGLKASAAGGSPSGSA